MDKSNDIGTILKAERELRGLTLEVIQEATKIPIDSIKAIEEGYKIRTLTAFYYKSFVRLYAQHLGLDPQPILALIPSYQPVSKIVPLERPAFAKPDLIKLNIIAGPGKTVNWKRAIPFVAVVSAVILVGGGLFVVVKNVAEKIAVSSHQSAQAKAAVLDRADRPARSQKVAKAEKSEKGVRSVKPAVVEGVASSGTKTSESAAPSAGEVKDVRKVFLTVKATVTTWLTVRSDGKVVFKGSLKKGGNESWSALKKIEISGKEVNLLEYEVNGKNIGKLGRRDSNARKVVVTPEGLLVEK